MLESKWRGIENGDAIEIEGVRFGPIDWNRSTFLEDELWAWIENGFIVLKSCNDLDNPPVVHDGVGAFFKLAPWKPHGISDECTHALTDRCDKCPPIPDNPELDSYINYVEQPKKATTPTETVNTEGS